MREQERNGTNPGIAYQDDTAPPSVAPQRTRRETPPGQSGPTWNQLKTIAGAVIVAVAATVYLQTQFANIGERLGRIEERLGIQAAE